MSNYYIKQKLLKIIIAKAGIQYRKEEDHITIAKGNLTNKVGQQFPSLCGRTHS